MADVHPCLTCGACCASFRVDFAADELDEQFGRVPSGLAVPVTAHTCRMRGTDHSPPRCAALTGQVGVKAACGIYEWRPSPCREFEAGSDACARARARHGLPALEGPLH
ncbi:YkgJ family cysteine cluster protein [Ramlibacter sp. MAHUQ-53]|uniref:YkgJ family cysteine cluster protein n=1 Tax=unclassified Ramlibacter TaxID=2617605 RepID=UPI00363F36FE